MGGFMELAAGLGGGERGQFRGKGVRGVRRETQFQQGNEGDAEPGFAAGAVHECGDSRGLASRRADDVNAFLDAPASGDDILDNEDAFAGGYFEIAPEDEAVVFLFGKDEAGAELAGGFLPEDKPAHRGGEDGGGAVLCGELGQEQFDEAGDLVEVLADLGALEVMGAVLAAAEDEMPGEEGARVAEDLQDFVLACVHGVQAGVRGGVTWF